MTKSFDYFVVLAEMRTGSNFLESNINSIDGLTCYGEAYNPAFIGYPSKADLLGVTKAMRDADPVRLLEVMKDKTEGLPGFRFFHNHDQRMIKQFLPDARCAKVILTRNPLESYVSWKIAQATDQWKLTNFKNQRTAQIVFDKAEFTAHLDALKAFQLRLLKGLQISGQSAFYIAYEDIPDIEVLNGLAAFLGVEGRIKQVSKSLKRQNPAPLRDKVQNYDEMVAALTDIDHFNLNHTPNFEPRRGPVVPSYLAAPDAPLMYMPIKGAADQHIRKWLTSFGEQSELLADFTQKTLRKWKRSHPGHRSFTVVRHPVLRAHAAFCDYILSTGPGSYAEIRDRLRQNYDLPIPEGAVDDSYDRRAHRAAFLAFLRFLKDNLTGQTSIRIDPAWCSQAQVLQGFSNFMSPDMVLRHEQLPQGLEQLVQQIGVSMPTLPDEETDHPVPLSDIYDAGIETATREVYQRDYMMFGYRALQ
ncbi:MAG: nodulation protein NodH [Rhodobacterales bacterium]|nr:MAG: nodulation protein NodH [Rhodobacterales bacterium]